MKVVYEVEGREPYEWEFEPGSILVPEAEIIQKNTGLTYPEWAEGVRSAHPGALRGFIWVMLKRHVEPTTSWRQVNFPMSAVHLSYNDPEERAILASMVARQRRGDEMTDGEVSVIAELIEKYGEVPAADLEDAATAEDDTTSDPDEVEPDPSQG